MGMQHMKPIWLVILMLVAVFGCCKSPQHTRESTSDEGIPQDQRIALLIEGFKGRGADDAIAELIRIGKPAIPALIQALSHSNEEVRWGAAVTLGSIGDRRAAKPLGELTSDAIEKVRTAAFSALIGLLDVNTKTPDGLFPDGDAYSAARKALIALGPAAIKPLLQALSGERPRLRAAAADVLWRIKDPQVAPALIAALRDQASLVRSAAAMHLGFLEDPQAVQPLMEALKDSDDNVRSAAASSLARFADPRIVDQMIALLSDTSPQVRRAAIRGLTTREDSRAIDPIIGRLSDTDEIVRRLAASALGGLKDQKAIDPLLSALNDGDEDVRRSAVGALGKLRPKRAVAPLVALLSDKSPMLRAEALRTLGLIGDKEAVDAIARLIPDRDGDVRASAVQALGRIGDPGAIPPLLSTLKDSYSKVVLASVESLASFKDARIVEGLAGVLSHDDEVIRATAAISMGCMGQPGVDHLLKSLGDASDWVRSKVVCALGHLGDQRALGPLQTLAASDVSAEVKQAAEKAIQRLKSGETTPGDLRKNCRLFE
jgi:HEAT repeat protein